MNHKGAVVWLTGLPGSGKSAIAREIDRILLQRGARVELLDGPEVRRSLSRDLGFSREDREENARRIGYVAKLLARNGVIAICAAISPYRATRDEVRRNVTEFVEVFVDCPPEVAEAREAALYAAARRGELGDFTGVNAPYEAPERPEVHVRSDQESPDQGARAVIRTLERLGIIPPGTEDDRSTLEDEIRRRLSALGYL